MIPGFKKRLLAEIKARIDVDRRFKELLGELKDEIDFVEIAFPPNILNI